MRCDSLPDRRLHQAAEPGRGLQANALPLPRVVLSVFRKRRPGQLQHPERNAPTSAARFEPQDPQDLVDLSLGCPFCGGQAGLPRLSCEKWAYRADALCRCTTCERSWVLELDLAQIRRLFVPLRAGEGGVAASPNEGLPPG